MINIPTLLLDESRCRQNIKKMVLKAQENHLHLRPHFKTHQSIEIGEWFKEWGIDRITVSSLTMASYFSKHWKDITVAFPVNILEIDRINDLAQNITLNLLVESLETLSFLKKHLKYPVGIFFKIDTGYHRTGIAPDNKELIEPLIQQCLNAHNVEFKGLLAHAGHTYNCRNASEIIRIHEKSIQVMKELRATYLQDFPQAIISLGDTPSCSVANNFEGVDEIRPGNFVFYDLMQEQIGSNTIDEIAVALACPIVTIHKNKLIIYGGGIHFSKERIEDSEHGTIYGKVVEHESLQWTHLIPDMYVSKLSQEHGTIHLPESKASNYKVGDYLVILPVHSCMTANLMKDYLTTDNQVITTMNS
jgi:D-serine deaminase-like pyridoxal phosphate-dependent protein